VLTAHQIVSLISQVNCSVWNSLSGQRNRHNSTESFQGGHFQSTGAEARSAVARPILAWSEDPGIGAEERGQGEAIARNLLEMARLQVPTIATVTGEGGSGGALALAVADRVLMLENAIYTVISPEGCASIMWKDAGKKQLAAAALRYTAFSAKDLGCVDDVLTEPDGGTHLDPACAMAMVDERLRFHLAELDGKPMEQLLEERYNKFRNIAQFYTTAE